MLKETLKKSWIAALVFFILSCCLYAEAAESAESIDGPGVVERQGEIVPLKALFHDETGAPFTLGELIKRPTVVSFAYFSCKNQCNTVQSNVADALGRLDAAPGQDYSVLTISIDESDTPSDALSRKRNYIKAVGRPFPDEAWRFLTGDAASITEVASAAGFAFKREGEGYSHPAVMVILSPTGRITRYIYGATYLPSDIKMALTEAAGEKALPSIRKVMLLCYTYDPGKRAYVFDILKAAGVATLVFAAAFFIYLTASGRAGRD